jgi:hypothetical protein
MPDRLSSGRFGGSQGIPCTAVCREVHVFITEAGRLMLIRKVRKQAASESDVVHVVVWGTTCRLTMEGINYAAQALANRLEVAPLL